jgi:flagellar hook assembly protein FlgD
LNEAYPNPFNPSTTLTFSIPEGGHAELVVYDITGRIVRTLVSGPVSAGTHTKVWDGRDDSGQAVSSGIYLSRLKTGKHSATVKMTLVK